MLSFGKNVDQQNLLYTAGGYINWYKQFGIM